MNKVTTVAGLLLSVGVLAACGTDGPTEEPASSDDRLCADGPSCWPDPEPEPYPVDPPPRADLVAEIASGAGCPLNNGETITVRVKNKGQVAASKSVVRVRRYYKWNGVQFYDYSSYYLVPALAAGASTTSGVYLGDGVNGVFISNVYPNGGDGATFPVTSPITFQNAKWPTNPSSTLLYWQLTVDSAFPKSWFNWKDAQGATHTQEVSYSAHVTESSELNNTLGGNGFCQ
jgi:hypothetical protein